MEDRLLDRLLDTYNTLRELLYTLALKCPRCREPMSVELKPLRDEWGRMVYRLVLVCYKCNYELVSNVIFSERGA
jgi:C4-type Zn-finger protein